ncbi:MAG: hypothetical protein S4CHLAM6_00980 [Chlamydiae bacterium]|nr:hypothetical protein [Chlamydiota bacterium]
MVKIDCRAIGVNKVVGLYPSISSVEEGETNNMSASKAAYAKHYPKYAVVVKQITELLGLSGLMIHIGDIFKKYFSRRTRGLQDGLFVHVGQLDFGFKKFLVSKVALFFQEFFSSQSTVQVLDDSKAYNNCNNQLNCIKNTFSISPHQAIEAVKYIDEASGVNLNRSNSSYRIFSNNCVDFVRSVMKATKVQNFENRMKLEATISLFQRVRSIAWHYLFFKSWWES